MTTTPDPKADASHVSVELKPCPFCDGPAVIRDADEQTQFYVACQTLDCYCCVGEGYDRDAMPDHVFRDRESAAAAWNHRASHAATQAALGSMREVLNSIVTECGGKIRSGGPAPEDLHDLSYALVNAVTWADAALNEVKP